MMRKPLYFIFLIAVILVLSVAFMFLWNLIVPQVTHLSTITYWQALGLLALSRILFGRFSFGRGWPFDRQPDHILSDKLAAMNDAEKAAFKEEWRKRCGRR